MYYDDTKNYKCVCVFFRHLISYKDQRFANDPRFRFFALNSVMRWTALRGGSLYVKHHQELQGKTVKELKSMLAENPSLVKQIMCYGTKLRGGLNHRNKYSEKVTYYVVNK